MKTTPEQNSTAFEYVVGTLRGDARVAFEQQLAQDPDLQAEVNYWSEHLMALQNPTVQRSPQPQTWKNIQQMIQPGSTRSQVAERPSLRIGLWQWLLSSAMAVILAAVLIGYYPGIQSTTPNTDYVAVLVNPEGKAVLTALTTSTGKEMWLKWENLVLAEDTSVQLWAVSRRDGETRPIAVFDTTDTARLALTEANLRLVNDAEFLLLTEEESGGSALDEPSDELIAKGGCVRFSPPVHKS